MRATISDLGPLLLGAPVQPQRDAAGRARARLQDRRRQRPAAARSEGPARDAAVCRRQRAQFTTKYGNISAASIGAIQRALLEIEQQGGDVVLRRADARRRRSAADRRPGPRHGQRPGGRRADPVAEALRDLPAVDAVGAVRAAARSRRSRQADAGVLLRRSAPAVHRRAAGADREDRAGRAADPVEGRRRLLRHPEPGRRPGHRARPARQPRAARAARVHAARSEGGEDRRRHAAAEPEARHRRARSPSWRSARRWCRCSTRRAARPSPSGRGSRRRLAHRPDHRRRARPPSASRPGRSTGTTSRRSIASRRTRSSGREGRKSRRGGTDRKGRRGGTGGNHRHGGSSAGSTITDTLSAILLGTTGPRGGHHDGLVQSAAKSAARSVGSGLGRAILRGALGSILGGSTRRSR